MVVPTVLDVVGAMMVGLPLGRDPGGMGDGGGAGDAGP